MEIIAKSCRSVLITYVITLRRLVTTGFVFFFVINSYGQITLDIEKAFEIIEVQNLELTKLKLLNKSIKNNSKEIKNELLPEISLGVNRNYNLGLAFDQVSGQLVTGNRWSNLANASVSMQAVIFRGFRFQDKMKNFLLELETSELEILTERKRIKIEFLKLFFDAQTYQTLHELSLEQIAFSREFLLREIEKVDKGVRTLLDLSIAENRLKTDEINSILCKTEFDKRIFEIKHLLNIPYKDSVFLQKKGLNFIVDQTEREKIVTKNPYVRKAEIALEQTYLNLNMVKKSYYPTINFFGGYGTNYSSERRFLLGGDVMPFWNQLNENKIFYLNFSLSLPIFDKYETKNSITRLKIKSEIQKKELERIRLEQEKIYYLTNLEYSRAEKEFELAQSKYLDMKNVLDLMKERNDLGLEESINLSKSILDNNSAEFNMIVAKFSVLFTSELLRVLFRQ